MKQHESFTKRQQRARDVAAAFERDQQAEDAPRVESLAFRVDVPALAHDAMMLERFGVQVSLTGRIERRIVAGLCAHLHAHCFEVSSVYDGEVETPVRSVQAAMELVFNLDEVSLRFRLRTDAQGLEHGVYLVPGNGVDIISDWNYTHGDPDGFHRAMDVFKAEEQI